MRHRSSCACRGGRSRRAFSVIELLIVIAILGLLFAIGLGIYSGMKCRSQASSAKTTLRNLVAALSAYKTDFGDYPGAGSSLTADTTLFVKRLRLKDRQGDPYYRFTPGDLGPGGEFLSPFGQPYYYSIPGAPNPGPDGASHPSPYYLWTEGCRLGDPERQWEINNWSQ